MKNNTLSVKKLMKNLILRTLRQLYAVSEIIILIRWVTPPQKVENLQFEFFLSFEIPQLFKIFNFAKSSLFPSFFFIRYIYIYTHTRVYVLYSIHLWLILQVGFSAKWMWSDPSPSMLYSTQSIHKFFMCILFGTHSKSSLCPFQPKNLQTELLTYLIQIFGFATQTVPHPTTYVSTHPRSNTISTSQYVGDTCQAKEKGQGHVRPKSSGKQFFTTTINTPSPLPHFLYSARPLSSSTFSNPSAAATSSSPMRKSFTASTSSSSYSCRPRKSSLCRRHSCLPLLS